MPGLFKRRRATLRLLAAAVGILAASLGSAAWRWAHAPRVWRPEDVPVAFWSWRTETPAQADVDRATKETGARVLFVRAGQFDSSSGRVARVRAVSGKVPRGVELHLVYNATPALLSEFEGVDERALVAAFAETFRTDAERAARDGATVAGLQLDLDVPTRLLAKYARVLRAVRGSLPAGAQVSVTGLTTWTGAASLRDVLDAVDFWVPQFYGAEIPATVDRVIPIASPREVALAVARVRESGKPFYAGLAAYGYALLYSEKGKLIELRGDVDPSRVAGDRNFELVERRAFEARVLADGAQGSDAPLASEWRYVFRARDDEVLDGLVVRAGEQIVLDVPSSEHLRECVRGVREGAGERLLGISLFRLPTRGDVTTLDLAQIKAALSDSEAEAATTLVVERASADGSKEKLTNQLLLTAGNVGAGVALFGEGAFMVSLRVPKGSVRGVTRLEGFDTFETLCETAGANTDEGSDARFSSERVDDEQARLRPCSAARASVVRLGARAWPSGARARAGLSFEGDLPAELSASVAVRRDDGRVWRRSESLSLRGVEGR
jgi:hypothetical protein